MEIKMLWDFISLNHSTQRISEILLSKPQKLRMKFYFSAKPRKMPKKKFFLFIIKIGYF